MDKESKSTEQIPKVDHSEVSVDTHLKTTGDNPHYFIKDFYKEIADNAFDGLLCVSPKFVVLYANNTAHEMAGFASPSLIGRSVFDFIPIDQRSLLFEQSKIRTKGVSGSYQLNINVNGGHRQIIIRAKAVINVNNEYEYSIVILTDITEREGLKSQLIESESKLSHIFENISEGFIITNQDNLIIMANQAASYIFANQNDSLVGMNLNDLFDKSKMQIVKFEHSSYHSPSVNKYEIELTLPNDRIKHVVLSVNSQYDSKGNYTGALGLIADVTDAKITQQKLLEKDRMFNRAQQIAKLGYLEFNVLTNQVTGSPQMYELYDLSNNERLPNPEEHKRIYLHPDDLNKYNIDEEIFQKSNGSILTEHRIITKNGNIKFIRAVIEPEFNTKGELIKLFGTVTDETELHIAKLTQQEFETRFYQIFQNAPDAIAITDIKTSKVLAANRNIYCILGYKVDEMIGKNILDMNIWIHAEQRTRIIEALIKDKHVYNFSTTLRTQQKDIIHVLLSAEYLEIDGHQCGMFIFHNVSDLINTQQALIKSEEKFRTLIEQMTEGVIITDAKQRIVYCNDQVCNGLKSTRIELINKTIFELNIADSDKNKYDLHLDKLQNSLESKIELQMIDPDGEPIFFNISSQPIMKNGKFSGAINISTNITELKKNQLEQEKTIEKLKATLDDVKTLSGLLPICSYCKKIRNDDGYWLQLEEYFSTHSDAKFTHSICNDCLKKMP